MSKYILCFRGRIPHLTRRDCESLRHYLGGTVAAIFRQMKAVPSNDGVEEQASGASGSGDAIHSVDVVLKLAAVVAGDFRLQA